MRRERSKKETEGGQMVRGGNRKRDQSAHFISGVYDLLPEHHVAPVGVEKSRPRSGRRASGEKASPKGREEASGSRGARSGGKTSKYFL